MNHEKVWKKRGGSWADKFTAHPIRTLFLVVILLSFMGIGFSVIGGVFGWFGYL